MWCSPLHLTKLYHRILGRDTSLIHTVRSSRASWSRGLKAKKAFGLLVADRSFHSIKPCVKISSTSAQLSGTFQIWQDICCLTRCILLAQYVTQFGKFLYPWVWNSRISMRLSSTLWFIGTDGSISSWDFIYSDWVLWPLGFKLGAQVRAHLVREIKIGQPKPPELYIPLPIPDEWGDHIAIDFVGPLSLDMGSTWSVWWLAI